MIVFDSSFLTVVRTGSDLTETGATVRGFSSGLTGRIGRGLNWIRPPYAPIPSESQSVLSDEDCSSSVCSSFVASRTCFLSETASLFLSTSTTVIGMPAGTRQRHGQGFTYKDE